MVIADLAGNKRSRGTLWLVPSAMAHTSMSLSYGKLGTNTTKQPWCQRCGYPWPSSCSSLYSCTTPTDIEQAMHTMNLNVHDENRYIYIGASSDMAAPQGLPRGSQS